jgi:hypothetical protein
MVNRSVVGGSKRADSEKTDLGGEIESFIEDVSLHI